MPNTLDVLLEAVVIVSRYMIYKCSKATRAAITVVNIFIVSININSS
jgi:hypothetical protein